MFQTLDVYQVQSLANKFINNSLNFRFDVKNTKEMDYEELLKAHLKKLQIVNWYNTVRSTVGLTTAHSMQLKFSPQTFVRRFQEPTFNNNKWKHYRDGKHKPNKELIDLVDTHIPGSAREFHHPLWIALDISHDLDVSINSLFRKLNFQNQEAIFEFAKTAQNYGLRKASNQQIAKSISKICDFDSLTALTIFTREAIDSLFRSDAHFWANETYKMLLILGLELQERNIAIPIIELYRNFFFSMSGDDGLVITDSIQDIVYASSALALLSYKSSNNKNSELTWKKRVILMRKLLKKGNKNDLYFAFTPKLSIEYKTSKIQTTKIEDEILKKAAAKKIVAQILQSSLSFDINLLFISDEIHESNHDYKNGFRCGSNKSVGLLRRDFVCNWSFSTFC